MYSYDLLDDTGDDDWIMSHLMEDDDIMDLWMTHLLDGAFGDDSDEDDEPMVWGGSVPGKRANINRNRAFYGELLVRDYFAEGCTYTDEQFRRRFRMRRSLFLRILDAVVQHDDYFRQKYDACSVAGLSPHQKVCACVQMLATGLSADSMDERYRMGKSTSLQALKFFCMAIIEIFGDEYLRSPTAQDLERILSINADRGFPGMGGSVDCMHVKWKNCPKAWAGQYKGKEDSPTIVLEAVVLQDLWFWHTFFGMAGSNNNINVLDRSPLFDNLVNGIGPSAEFVINGTMYSMVYYLGNGIYPEYQTFVKTIPKPVGLKNKFFASKQEALRKDVERAFGVLQARFHIITLPCKLWDQDAINTIIRTCVILHNMIVEDERNDDNLNDDYWLANTVKHPFVIVDCGQVANTPDVAWNVFSEVVDKAMHRQLQCNLIEHLWAHHGDLDE